MRIWIIHQHAVPPIEMGATRHYELAKKMIEEGHEVVIFAGNFCHYNFRIMAEPFHRTKKLIYYDDVPFVWLSTPPYKKNSIQRLWNMLVFAYRLAVNKHIQSLAVPDLIIGSSPSPFAAWAAAYLARRYRVPFVYEIRDLWPETLLSLGKFHRYHPLVVILHKIEKKLVSQSNKIIAVLPGIKDYLAPKNIPKEKILYLPNFIDLEHIMYQPLKRTDTVRIIYAGSFNVANDITTLLRAAKILQEQAKDNFLITLMGDGPLKTEYLKFIVTQQLKNIKFLPAVAKNQIHSVLSEATILVAMTKNSNLYRWGTSLNKISDYLAVARPIIFALDSVYDPITAANAGITITPEDPNQLAQAIQKLAILPLADLSQLGLNGRNYAQKHHNLATSAQELMIQLKAIVEAQVTVS